MSDCQNISDWSIWALSDLAHYHNGFAFKPKDWSEDGVRIIRIEQLNNPKGNYDRFRGIYPSTNQINDGDLIFSWSATLRVLIWQYGSCVLNQHLFRVDEKDGFDKIYIYYVLDYHMDSLANSSHGSTMKHIKRGELQKYKVPIPRLIKQRKIAEILQTIDRAIAHTEALIEKYKQIKAGLMHDLLTRGIGADGKLRPPCDQAPELYQESAIGWIPKEWDCTNLRQVADLDVGFAFKSDWFQEDGIKLLRGENVGYGQPDWKDMQCLSYDKSETFKEYLLCKGDMVIGMDRTFTKSGVKITVLQAFDCPSLLVQRVGRFVAFGCHKSYLRWVLISDQYLRALINQQKGMDIPHLSKAEILEPLIPLPPESEQIDIVRRTEACEHKIQKECEILEKLAKQKSGLMHDLLTGKVPVKVDADEVDND